MWGIDDKMICRCETSSGISSTEFATSIVKIERFRRKTITKQTQHSVYVPFSKYCIYRKDSCTFSPPDSHLKVGGAAIFPGADCHQSSTIPPWPMCVTIQGQTVTSHQPFHPGLCVSLSRGRLPPVINHSTLVYVWHYPGADCHQSSTIPPWPMCVTIQGPSIPSEVDSTIFEKGGLWVETMPKENKGIHLALVRSPCLSRIEVNNRCLQKGVNHRPIVLWGTYQ